MKVRLISEESAIDIIHQYWNELGETISFEAREQLSERIGMASVEIELTEDQHKALAE